MTWHSMNAHAEKTPYAADSTVHDVHARYMTVQCTVHDANAHVEDVVRGGRVGVLGVRREEEERIVEADQQHEQHRGPLLLPRPRRARHGAHRHEEADLRREHDEQREDEERVLEPHLELPL